MSSSARARRDSIVALATSAGLASVEELSRRFGVTASTIRRDLAALESQRKLARTFGGAMAVTAHPEASFHQRLGENPDQKRAIARHAATMIEVGQAILLDNGSTTTALAHQLGDVTPLTVATTSVGVVSALSTQDDIELICLGGQYRPLSRGFVGPLAEVALEHLTFDTAFLGADAVSARDGICEADLRQVRLKEIMARRAERVCLLADSSKLGRRTFHAWTRLGVPWTLITDDGADPETIGDFRAEGIPVELAHVEV